VYPSNYKTNNIASIWDEALGKANEMRRSVHQVHEEY